ncbi:MAG: LysM peptidoglycan-binding domain-containing protein [Bacteroides sp.]|nr:LysM peptidoglycan-binding domain-containing protein [Bacteroides sp.]MCM1389732.1 LysM peptidoglycan-binding domain-containing protein [Bacteroides sp.]
MKLSFKYFRKAAQTSLIAVFAAIPFTTSALDLPIKDINGAQYYFREVKPKETIYGLCRELGMSKDEIVRHNPSVGDGLKAGMTLYFPVSEYGVEEKKKPATVFVSETPKVITTADAHLVEKGETIYGISRHYGISEEELIAANPQIASGLKTGILLNIPSANTSATAASAQTVPAPVATPVPQEQSAPVPQEPEIRNGIFISDSNTQTPEATETENTDAEEATEEDADADSPVKIAVILPFMLNESNQDKQTQLYTEFFKGMLLAADSLKNNKTEIIIDAYDSANSIDTVRNIISRPEFAGTDIIIVPDNDQQLSMLASYADTTSATILNIFAVKNTDYVNNPRIMQANIPHSQMYQQAVKSFIEEFDGYTPVILSSEEGKHDKEEFVNLLKYSLNKTGKNFETINYSGYLKSSDLSSLKSDGHYVFVPVSGSVSEFNHVISALKNYRESSTDFNSIRLFGYPEWITFRGDALENLHTMNATVYSRFFNDESDSRSKRINEKYTSVYGSPMMAAVPVQGILGFDTGFFLLSAIDNDIEILDGNTFHNGIQSGFHFVKQDDAKGKVNDLLYFVNFRPSGLIDKRVLQ